MVSKAPRTATKPVLRPPSPSIATTFRCWPGANRGICTIEIDGVPVSSIDFYELGYPSSPSQYLLSDSLTVGLHTVVIRVTGFAVHPIQYELSPAKYFYPFRDHQYLVMEFEAKLPSATSHGTEGIGYFGPNITIKDRTTNTIFYISTQLYDNRTSVSENLIIDACSACSGNVIVATVLKPDSQ